MKNQKTRNRAQNFSIFLPTVGGIDRGLQIFLLSIGGDLVGSTLSFNLQVDSSSKLLTSNCACIHFLISANLTSLEDAASASTAKELHNSLYRFCLGVNFQASELFCISVCIGFNIFLPSL